MGKVLLVEDDNNLREIFEMRLQAEGYQTISAEDGEKALDIATREKPELIIADIMMPRLSGFEMLENLKAVPGDYKPKVIIMTALGQDEDQARGQKLGVVKYLVKSQVTLEDFVRVVREVMPPSEDKAKASSTTNTQESERVMQDDNTNQSMPPAGGDSAAPAGDSGQMGAAEEKDMVNQQMGDAMGGASAPAGDSTGAGSAPAADDGSMAGGGTTPPAADTPTTPPAPEAPAGDNGGQGGPATPPPAGGM